MYLTSCSLVVVNIDYKFLTTAKLFKIVNDYQSDFSIFYKLINNRQNEY